MDYLVWLNPITGILKSGGQGKTVERVTEMQGEGEKEPPAVIEDGEEGSGDKE